MAHFFTSALDVGAASGQFAAIEASETRSVSHVMSTSIAFSAVFGPAGEIVRGGLGTTTITTTTMPIRAGTG